MSILLKASKPLHDVLTCGEDGTSFISDRNLFKLKLIGSWEMTLEYDALNDWYTNTVEVTHNLGYVPGFSVHGEWPGDTAGQYSKFTCSTGFGTGTSADTTKLYIFAIHTSEVTISGYYTIYLDPLPT